MTSSRSFWRWVLRFLAVGALAALCTQPGVFAADSGKAASAVVEAVEMGAVRAQTGSLLLSGQRGGTVDGALIWSLSGHDENGKVEVPFVVEVDGGALLTGPGGKRIEIGVYAYVMDGEGVVVDHIAQGLLLETSRFRRRIERSGLKFVGRFELEPGDYTLRVMIQNNATGDFFISWSVLSLPAADDQAQLLLPPLFPDPSTQWVVARQNGGEATVSVGDGTEILPTARPVLMENQSAELYLGGSGWDPDAFITIRILNETGRTVSEPLVELSESRAGYSQFRRGVVAPVDLPPGDYNMIVTLADETTGEVLRRAIRVYVVGGSEERAWAGIRDSDPPREVSGVSDIPKRAKKVKKKEVRSAYRAALRPLGDGDVVSARRMLAEFERQSTENRPPEVVHAMGEGEYAEGKALAKANPSCLMLLALLHRDLYRGYSARREGVLAVHSRTMAITYAEDLGRVQPENGFSGWLMVDLALDLAQMGSTKAAQTLLERVIDLSPGFGPANLSLGFSFELTSDYIEAAAVYRRLVDTNPDSDEGRLRLGVNLIRNGRDSAGMKHLSDLRQGAANIWIKAVAAQELVRLLIQQGRMSEAEREVRAALDDMPEDQRLWILLAAILERTNRNDRAVEVLTNLPPASRGVSPRARYSEWPELGVRASQSHLAAWAAEAVPGFQAALAARGGVR